jgi:hypothetical protein
MDCRAGEEMERERERERGRGGDRLNKNFGQTRISVLHNEDVEEAAA